MKHARPVSKKPNPEKAQSSFVCGEFTLTGKIKCVPAGSWKARFIEDIPVP
ncbi:MAG: hypothetical protein HUU46_20045 [Candidatus Hydrogenedentes bacterium]|nr:hypothetical protein [Candidatus Hydrogenedentota bacterium]